jgi:hypothetical protein
MQHLRIGHDAVKSAVTFREMRSEVRAMIADGLSKPTVPTCCGLRLRRRVVFSCSPKAPGSHTRLLSA